MCFKKVKNSNNEFGHMVFCGWSHGKNKVRIFFLYDVEKDELNLFDFSHMIIYV